MKKYFLQFIGFFAMVLLGEVIFFCFLYSSTVFSKETAKKAPVTKGLVLFIPGLKLTSKDYQSITDNLKKNNYKVIAYNPTSKNATNYNATVTTWTKDVTKLVGDKKVIVIGHSIGGAVATHYCSIDKHCIAGINLDGNPAFDEKPKVTFLYIQADTGRYCDDSCMNGRALMTKIASQSGIASQSSTTKITIHGIRHYNFTDLRTQELRNQDYLGKIDGRDLINKQIVTFLQKNVN